MFTYTQYIVYVNITIFEVYSMENFIYRGPNTKEISFPLGGIGTGCIGLSGNGRFIDWEIFNKPNKRQSENNMRK